MSSPLPFSPRDAGYVLPPEFHRSCPEMDAVWAYRDTLITVRELWPDRGRDPHYATFRRLHVANRRHVTSVFTGIGWSYGQTREMMRCIAGGLAFTSPPATAPA